MVLGMKSKHKRVASVRVDYVVHIEEIRPWPPSESLKSVQTVLLQWESANQVSGSFLSVAGDSNIVFDESFTLPVTLYKDKKAQDKFKKNYLEFSLFEPRKDKAKGQLMGTASLNLADYGLFDDILSINTPLSFKKSSRNSVQPALIISLELVEKDSSSPSYGLSEESSLQCDDDCSEIASLTDDDASSHSSRAAGSSTIDSGTASPSQNDKNGQRNTGVESNKELKISWPSSNDSFPDTRSRMNDHVSLSKFSERSLTSVRNSANPSFRYSPSSISFREIITRHNENVDSFVNDSASHNSHEEIFKSEHKILGSVQQVKEDNSFQKLDPEAISSGSHRKNNSTLDKELRSDALINNSRASLISSLDNKERKDNEYDEHGMEGTRNFKVNKVIANVSDNTDRRQLAMRSDTLVPSRKTPVIPLPSSSKARLKHVKSVHVHGPLDELGITNARQKEKDETFDCKNEWKTRIEMLEEELKEAAAIEIGLYSVVAEHASSGNKVHIPARRLSRFYSNICKAGSQSKRASAARAAVSGLVLISKTCGNDVPRLTYWLSNSIMLRAIISQIAAELPNSNVAGIKTNGYEPDLSGSKMHSRIDSSCMGRGETASTEEFDNWEDVLTFIIALEKVESWLFSRIVESLWWQTFTPHMQPCIAKRSERVNNTGTKKMNGRKNMLSNHEQGNFSIELWKKAFKDACERLCPIRAGGHQCGCLSVLVRLVMEQLVNRLDIAMFNAILRESAEEMPTDPLSDPISDSEVLPIPAGKSSFGAGAQLKNVIGNWSRWLSDLFGIEEDACEDINIVGDGRKPKSFKAFRLLHALSDLMMLPFGMIADASTRKEVCPTFGPTIIKRVLNNFVPDEFCPERMPRNIIDALDSEDISDDSAYLLTTFPCNATPTKYFPPSAALLTCVGEVGKQVLESSRLSTLKKSYASDGELDELDSPLTSIIPDSFLSSSALAKLSLMPKGGRNVVRYQLLREIWKDDEL